MYIGGDYSNVQDLSVELFDHGLFAFGPVSGWYQVWGLPGYDYRNDDECLFLVYLQGKGESVLGSRKQADDLACREVVQRTTPRKHFQLLRPIIGPTSIRYPYRIPGLHDRSFQIIGRQRRD